MNHQSPNPKKVRNSVRASRQKAQPPPAALAFRRGDDAQVPAARFVRYSIRDPLPPSMDVNLTYVGAGLQTVGGTSLTGTENVFRLASLFDPDFTSTGHQPYMFDQMAALYSQYLVRAVRVDLLYTDPSTDGLYFNAMVQPSNASFTTSSQTVERLKEMPMSAFVFVNNTGSQVGRVAQRFTIPEIEGISRNAHEGNLSQYSAAVTTNPTLTPWLRFAIGSMNSADSTATMKWTLTLTFEVHFFNRQIAASS